MKSGLRYMAGSAMSIGGLIVNAVRSFVSILGPTSDNTSTTADSTTITADRY